MAKSRDEQYWCKDLLTTILLRLPVKSIIRFQELNNRLLVYHYDYNLDKVGIQLFLDQTPVCYQDLFQQIPQHISTRYPQLYVHGGLVCFFDTINSRISLWNPATRKFRLLPEFNEGVHPKVNSHMLHQIGFGLDSSNDYKVIYFREYVDLETDIPAPRRHHAVYNMSTDTWRLLQGKDVDFFGDLLIFDNANDAWGNGVHYWIALKFLHVNSPKVLSFHLNKEVFQLIDWPPVVEPDESIRQLLPLPDNRISLLFCHNSDEVTNRIYDIWELDEKGSTGPNC
ncbi:hypothetical protein DITRI_Ditri09bG0091900 [Diplodiscus trichospermus]